MNRSAGLDGLRALAAMMVFLHHVRLPGTNGSTDGFDAGVAIFFVLSGYLLYRPFLVAGAAGRGLDIRSYAIRRVARIYPAFLVACVILAVVNGWTFYLLDPIGLLTATRTPIAVAWTLAIELAFYVLLPVFALVALRLSLRGRLRALAIVALVSLAIGAVRTVVDQVVPIDPFSLMWQFIPGMAVAELDVARPDLMRRLASPAAGVAGILLIGISVVVNSSVIDMFGSAGAALLVAWIVNHPITGRASVQVLTAAGALSYPVYLWHLSVIDAVDRPSTWSGAALALAVTLGIGAVSYVVVERPAIQLGKRLTSPNRRQPVLRDALVTPP